MIKSFRYEFDRRFIVIAKYCPSRLLRVKRLPERIEVKGDGVKSDEAIEYEVSGSVVGHEDEVCR